MILLFTDFGGHDIYVGQVKTVLAEHAPEARIIDLLHDAPDFNARAGAYLLAALSSRIPPLSVTLAIVDAGVGSARIPLVLQADDRWFVGPDNGLLSVIAARANQYRIWEIVWRPQHLSNSFHGRDLFAPIAAMLEKKEWWPAVLVERDGLDVAFQDAQLPEIIYIDHYGNAMTGLRADGVLHTAILQVGDRRLPHARVFSEVKTGELFWYENSIGLVEIAVNAGSAAKQLTLSLGDSAQWINGPRPEENSARLRA